MTKDQAIGLLDAYKQEIIENVWEVRLDESDLPLIDYAISALKGAPVVHAHWDKLNECCSLCGGSPYYYKTLFNYKYCPFCGAKMDEMRVKNGSK